MIRITPTRTEDRADWLALWADYLAYYRTVLTDEMTALTFERMLDPEFGLYGAIARDDAGTAVGIVHWQFHLGTWSPTVVCYLEDLFVASSARRSGTGRALIAHVREHAVARGATQLYWHTEETNATARALYDQVAVRSGFIHYEIDLDTDPDPDPDKQ